MHRNLHSEVFYHNREFHLIVFHLQKFIPAEINYDMNDNEFLAIVDSFEKLHVFSYIPLLAVFFEHHLFI